MNFATRFVNLKNQLLSGLLILSLFAQPLMVFANEEVGYVDTNLLFNSDKASNYGDFKSGVSSGDYTVNIPIEVPTGINGHTPSVSVNYNSAAHSSASVYGSGWSDNIPFIKRNNTLGSNKIYATSSVFYSSLHGDLVEVATNEFIPRVTESGNFAKYKLLPTGAWEVLFTDGQKLTFGDSDSAKIYRATSTTDIFSWGISRWEDKNSNLIDYSYIKGDGRLYIDEINYGFVSALDNTYTIKWNYDTRQDVRTDYSAGFLQKLDKKVTSIDFIYLNDIKKRYSFNFLPHQVTSPTSKLSEISLTSNPGSGGEHNLGSHKFTYKDNSNISFVKQGVNFSHNSNDSRHTEERKTLVDLNNNGLRDYAQSDGMSINDNFMIREERGIDLARAEGLTSDATFIDINGDGWADYYRGSGDDIDERGVWLSNKDGTFSRVGGWGFDDNYIVSKEPFVELNGDGLIDKYINGNFYLNTGTNYSNTGLNREQAGLAPHSQSSADDFLWIDLNGDGITDVIGRDTNGGGTTDDGIWRGNGDGTFTKITSGLGGIFLNGNLTPKKGQFVDFNGDGLLDFIYNRRATQQDPGGPDVGGGHIFINQGNFNWVSLGEAHLLGVPNEVVRDLTFLDYNHDGAVDVKLHDVGNGENGYYINTSENSYLEEVEFISGGKEIVEYSHVSKQGEDNHVGGKHAVTGKTYDDGLGNIEEMTYQYSGGEIYFTSPQDRKPAGFEVITERHEDKELVTTTYFHQGNGINEEYSEPSDTYGKIGKPYKVVLKDLNSNELIEEKYYGWNDLTNTYGETSTLLTLENIRTYHRDDYKDIAVAYEYDLTHGGNLVTEQLGEVNFNETFWGYDDVNTSDNKIRETLYASNSDIHLPSQVTLKNSDGDVISDQRTFYDNLPLGQFSTGNPTTNSVWEDVSNTWIDNESEYNTYGLVTKQTDGLGRETDYVYDTKYLYPETVANDEGQHVQSQYDYISGQITKTTDQNGVFSEKLFDIFGRLVEERKSTPTGTSVTTKILSYDDTSLPRLVHSRDFLATNDLDTYTYLDGLGRVVQVKKETSDNNYSTKTFNYGDAGRLESETLPYVTSDSDYDSSVSSSIKEIEYIYDQKDRVTQKIDPMGTEVTRYENFDTEISNKKGYSSIYTNDAFGNLERITQQLNTLGATSSEPVPDAYQYKQKITLSGASGAGTGYQVLIKVGETDSTSDVDVRLNGNSRHFPFTRNDGGDLQFYANDEITELPFWVEKVEGEVAYVWVRVSENLETEKDIYIYYGHRTPINFSDGDSTFMFFDEFEGYTLDSSKWTGSGIRVENGFAEIIGAGVDVLTSKNTFGGNTALNFTASLPQAASHDTTAGYGFTHFYSLKDNRDESGIKGMYSDTYVSVNPDFRNSFHQFEITRPEPRETNYYLDQILKRTETRLFTSNENIVFEQSPKNGRAGNTKVDWVSVRKFVENGPVVLSVSSEEDIAGVHEKFKIFASAENTEDTPEEIEEEIIEFEELVEETEISDESPVVENSDSNLEESEEDILENLDIQETGEAEVGSDQSSEIQEEETTAEEELEESPDQDGQSENTEELSEEDAFSEVKDTPQESESDIVGEQDEETEILVATSTEDVQETQDNEVQEVGESDQNELEAATSTNQTQKDATEQDSELENISEKNGSTDEIETASSENSATGTEDLPQLENETPTTTEEIENNPGLSEENILILATSTDSVATSSEIQDEEFFDDLYQEDELEGDYEEEESLITDVVINDSINLQKPAKSYNYKEKVWLLDGKISKKESQFLNLQNRILKKRQTLSNINSSIEKKRTRIDNIQDKIKNGNLKNKTKKVQKEKLKDNRDKLKNLLSKKENVKSKISELKDKKSKIKLKVKDLKKKEKKLTEKITLFFIGIKENILSFFKTEKAHANTWSNESYAYKIPVTISGSSGAGTEYQVLLKIGKNGSTSGSDFNLNGNSLYFPTGKDDGGDLVFYSSDGIERLPFWVEKVESDVAHIWIKVSEDLSASDKIIDLYFGNSGPVNYSDGENTFIYFEDMKTSPVTAEPNHNFFTVGETFPEVADYALHIKQDIPNFEMHKYGSKMSYGLKYGDYNSSNMFSLRSDTDWHPSYVMGAIYLGGTWDTARVPLPDVSVHNLVMRKDGSNFDVLKDESLLVGGNTASESGITNILLSGIDISNAHGETNGFSYDSSNNSLTFSATRDDTDKNISVRMYEIFVRKFKENEPQFSSAGQVEVSGGNSGEAGTTAVETVELVGHIYTYYEYDLQGNIIKITDPDGNEREFVYDSLGRQLSSELPHVPGETAAVHTYTYDSVGNKTSETRPDGTVINYTYDNLNRLLTVNNPAVSGIETTYTYDTALNGIGKLATVTGPNYSKTYSYDKAGNVISESVTVGGQTHTTSYVYSDYGLLESTTYPDGTVVVNTYNIDGSIDSVSKDSSNLVSFEYNHIGQITDKDYANGIEEDYVYSEDTMFRLESKSVSSGTTTLEDIAYAYDEIGNVTSIENSGSEIPYTKLYSYDSLERLQTATTTIDAGGGASTTEDVYTYSNSGNILSHNSDIYTYGNVTFPQAVTTYKGNTYSYDSNGNLSEKNDGTGTTTYSYDWNDRLSSVDNTSGNIATYGYSENRQRLSKVVGTSTKYYIGETTEIENGQTTNFAFAGSGRIATIDNVGDITYSNSDHLGSGSLETNNVGAVTSVLTYTPYGSEEYTSGAKSNNHTYTDQEKDSETGLMYYNARYYDTDLKRFTSVDAWGGEITDPQSMNKYTYVNNNPLKYTDPTGDTPLIPLALAAAGAYFLSPSYTGENMTVQSTDIVENLAVGSLGGDYDSMSPMKQAGVGVVTGALTANPKKIFQSVGDTSVLAAKSAWKSQYKNERVADKISGNLWRVGGKGNHGTDHRPEFYQIEGITDEKDISNHLSRVISSPDKYKDLGNGSGAYADYETGTVIIHRTSDEVKGGTAFIRGGSRDDMDDYVDNLD